MLQQDLNGSVGRAAAPEKLGGQVEVDLAAQGELERKPAWVPGLLERITAPLQHALLVGLKLP